MTRERTWHGRTYARIVELLGEPGASNYISWWPEGDGWTSPEASEKTILPFCSVDGCFNESDPRWWVQDFETGKYYPACDGHDFTDEQTPIKPALLVRPNPQVWWNAFTRAWFRISEHFRVDAWASNTVTCRRCHQHYNAYGEEKNQQGHDMCAWSKFEKGRWVLHCGYGSAYDMREFWFIDQFPTEPQDGICDFCIMRMLAAGVIIDSGLECPP